MRELNLDYLPNRLTGLHCNNPTWINDKRRKYFKGKTVNEWCDILGGAHRTLLTRIKNDTMMTYPPYRKYLGLDELPHPHTKRLFEGKSVKQWTKILHCNYNECLKHIRNGTMLEYNPYRKYLGLKPLPRKREYIGLKPLPRKREYKCKWLFEGKTVKEWSKLLQGDKGVIRDHIRDGTMQNYKNYILYKLNQIPKA